MNECWICETTDVVNPGCTECKKIFCKDCRPISPSAVCTDHSPPGDHLKCLKCGKIAVYEIDIGCDQCDPHCYECEKRYCDNCFNRDDYVWIDKYTDMCKECERKNH